jgi:rhodanese-related sulfurtransferase
MVANTLISAGYTNVSIVTGGMDAWLVAKYPVETGRLATAIIYVPKPRVGEIAIDDFKKIAAATPADTIIIDVRSRDEAAEGMIKGAILIPDEELLDRLAEIPKDKQIITYCSTGVRAEMAYYKLKEKGYKTSFLNAKVEIDKNWRYTLEKL